MVAEKCPACISLEWAFASHLKRLRPHWSVQAESWACALAWELPRPFSVHQLQDSCGYHELSHGTVLGSWAGEHFASAWFCFAFLVFPPAPARFTPPRTRVHMECVPVPRGCRKMTQLWFQSRRKSMHPHKHLSGRCGSCSLFVSKLLLSHFF